MRIYDNWRRMQRETPKWMALVKISLTLGMMLGVLLLQFCLKIPPEGLWSKRSLETVMLGGIVGYLWTECFAQLRWLLTRKVDGSHHKPLT
jgi:hypothetical protein